jgi:P-type Ca2+ transporter type 2C
LTTWHNQTLGKLFKDLKSSSETGLSSTQVTKNRARFGENSLHHEKQITPWVILFRQFTSIVIWVLIGAALLAITLGEVVDGVAIITIVMLNGLIGFYQEYKAERSAAALAHLTAPRAKVIRDGQLQLILATEIVPGDILVLEGGDLVAADARLFQSYILKINEAPLTGESQPVEKQVKDCDEATPLAERTNMVFMGTSAVNGTGRALVIATGMDTELGKITKLLDTTEEQQTPLQQQLNRVGNHLLLGCLGIVSIVAILGLIRNVPALEVLMSAVSLAVAAIPEGLPAVVGIALALGMLKLARRKALVKQLSAVETLGCTEVICTDKTGTLTIGLMTARKIVTPSYDFAVEGEKEEKSNLEQGALFHCAILCNDAELVPDDSTSFVGDPTEGALLLAAVKAGIDISSKKAKTPRVSEIPFDSDRKRMSVICEGQEGFQILTKGAPEVILERCDKIYTDQGIKPFDAKERTRLQQTIQGMTDQALRVLAFAERRVSSSLSLDNLQPDQIEQELIFLGFIGLQDPPRPESKDAIARCRQAGIKTVMITGDHPDTARAIARELGILEQGDDVVTGTELEQISDEDLRNRVKKIAVYARVTAEHKLKIVRAWKSHQVVVAMTGDGVNDAPALKEASIGIAMGITGTEVSKEVADIIITDDNFASIVTAVEEGRGIYDNISKSLGYLLAGNSGELLFMLLIVSIGWPIPLQPIHLLWINLVTDGLPALALATDQIDPTVLKRKPRKQNNQLLNSQFFKYILFVGFLTALCAAAVFAYEYRIRGDLNSAQDAAFTTFVIAELLRSFGARSSVLTVWELGVVSNIRLFVVVMISLFLQFSLHHVAFLKQIFNVEAVTLAQCFEWFAFGCIPVAVLEIYKMVKKYNNPNHPKNGLSAKI